MGSGAGTLRQNLGQHVSIEYHIRLNRPGRPFHGHVMVITLSRIPEVEIDVLDQALMNQHQDDYDYGHVSDYDYDSEEEVEEWLRVTRF